MDSGSDKTLGSIRYVCVRVGCLSSDGPSLMSLSDTPASDTGIAM